MLSFSHNNSKQYHNNWNHYCNLSQGLPTPSIAWTILKLIIFIIVFMIAHYINGSQILKFRNNCIWRTLTCSNTDCIPRGSKICFMLQFSACSLSFWFSKVYRISMLIAINIKFTVNDCNSFIFFEEFFICQVLIGLIIYFVNLSDWFKFILVI